MAIPGHESMTSRERVVAAIDHREPDRVPVDLGSTTSSSISTIAYHNLKQHLGIKEGHTRVYDVVQQLAQPEDMILERYGVDVVDLGRNWNTEDAAWRDVTLPTGQQVQFPVWFEPVEQPDGSLDVIDGDGDRIATMPRHATFFDQTLFPYLDGYPDDWAGLSAAMRKAQWGSLPQSPWDHTDEVDFYHALRARAIELREGSDKALMVVIGCNLFEWGTYLRRLDKFLMDLVTEPTKVEAFLDALLEIHLETLGKVCRAVGDVAQVCRFTDDLGMDTGPLMSPDTYARLFKPRHGQLCAFVKEHSQMRTFLHSCGSIYELLPHLIEAGFDVVNPVQTNVRNMDPATLKKEFGRDVTFWGGGADTRRVLNRGSVDDVRADVLRNLRILSVGGGYVFNTIHNIMPDVPPENIEAMFAAVDEFNGR